MILNITPIRAIDWDSPGRRLYHIPFTMDGAWGRVRVPLCVICGPRPGKTIVAIGGTHGDEYEGPVGLKNLIGTLNPAEVVEGRVIVIPVLNVPAFQAAQRQSSQDLKNMNRVFPGNANGSITERIAHFVTTEVLARADVVIDIHAAGSTFEIVRSSSFHHVADPAMFAEYRATALLFGMPFGFGASTDLDGVRWAHHGTLNVMRHNGLLASPMENIVSAWVDKQRVVTQTDIDRYVTAPVSGISEPLVPLGSYVRAGVPVARLHDFDRFDEPGVDICADQDGYVLVRRFRAETNQGDVVMVIGQEVPE